MHAKDLASSASKLSDSRRHKVSHIALEIEDGMLLVMLNWYSGLHWITLLNW